DDSRAAGVTLGMRKIVLAALIGIPCSLVLFVVLTHLVLPLVLPGSYNPRGFILELLGSLIAGPIIGPLFMLALIKIKKQQDILNKKGNKPIPRKPRSTWLGIAVNLL